MPAVGIELTDANVKILSLEANGKTPKVLKFHSAPIPGGEAAWEERAAGALKEALAASGVPRGRVIASIDSGEAILRDVTLPFKGEDQIRKTVRYELESLVHNYTIEDLVVCHYKTGETEKGTHLLAAAVPKEVVRRRLKVLQDAGVDPVALDLDICAVFNSMLHAGAIDTDAPHLVVYGTTKFTKLVLVEGRQPRSIRTIRFAMPAPPAAPAKPMPAPPEIPGRPEPIVIVSEEESKRFSDLGAVEQAELVGILAKEISRFLLAGASSASPSHILLSGDFEDERAARMIEAATEIPVRTFSPFEAAPGAPPQRLGATLGLALKGLGQDALGMDFRQEEFLYRKKYEALKTTFLVTVELVIVLLAAISLHFWFQQREVKRATDQVQAHQLALYNAARDPKEEDLKDASLAFDRMDALEKKYRGTFAGDLPIRTSARAAWIELWLGIAEWKRKYVNQTLGEGSLFLDLETVDIQQNTTAGNESGTVTIRGKIENLEFLSALRGELRAKELLKNMDYLGPNTQVADNKVQFQMRAQWGKGK